MIEYQKGQVVTIKQGAAVHSYNPRKKNYVTTRKQSVKVAMQFNYMHIHHGKGPEISWAGAGGYWCHTSIDNVIPVT